MPGLKAITMEREKRQRASKDLANKNLGDYASNCESIEQDVESNSADKNIPVTSKKTKDPYVNNLAEGKEVNLEKHYRARMKCADLKEFIEVDKMRK